jgi:nucleoside-diphosphate-sugar epimerase
MILVTGGAGLLGTSLIEQLLQQGKRVKAIYHTTPLTHFKAHNFQSVHCDLLDVYELEEAMKGVDEIYHCAGLVSFSPKDERRLYKVNVEATANLVNAAVNAGVRKIVHVSSVAAMGRIRPGQMINESMNWTEETSNSKYGHSKYLGELEVWRGVAEGLNAVVVNPVIILGPGNWDEGSTKIFKSVYDEFPWYTEGTTGFVDVRDVAKAMIDLMESEISGERFIVSAENATYRTLFNMIADGFKKKRPSKKVTPFLAAVVWRMQALLSKLTGKSPLVTKETAATSLANVEFDNSKLLKFLPSFKYRPLGETVADTCAALQQKINS